MASLNLLPFILFACRMGIVIFVHQMTELCLNAIILKHNTESDLISACRCRVILKFLLALSLMVLLL